MLKTDRLTSAVPVEAGTMVPDLYGRLPAVRITGLMQEVDDDIGFATQNIPATVNEAPYVPDGLLMNEVGAR